MARSRSRKRDRDRGSIEELPSGALRVRVYAGLDPISHKRHYLTEVIPAGTPKAAAEAEKTRIRFINEIDERRNPRTNATVAQLLKRYLDQFDGAPNTINRHRGDVQKHLDPFLGHIKVGALGADILDSFYAECRRCSEHCDGRPSVQHRTRQSHDCDERCGRHECTPLSASSIRHMHYLLSGAYKRAIRWRWVAVSPISQAEPPAAPKPNPQPPTADQAARIVNEAYKDPDWGTFVWTAMTTGARRGELCALRWHDLNLDPEHALAWVRRAISLDLDQRYVVSDTKTHQQRRIALDPETAIVLSEHRDRCLARAAALDIELTDDAFVFSAIPDGSAFVVPGSVSQRYDRLAGRLGIKTTLHKLRHYSATELILAGVDVRTVGGRLGHAGGGTTTLRVYTAFVSEADQRAAKTLSGRMPARPELLTRAERAKIEPQAPYERIAAQIRQQILDGHLAEGDFIPKKKDIAIEHGVALSTAYRVMGLLRTWGLIDIRQGQRSVVIYRRTVAVIEVPTPPAPLTPVLAASSRQLLDFEIVHQSAIVRKIRTDADPNDPADLRQILIDAVLRLGRNESEIGLYELNIRQVGQPDLMTTFVATAR
jgi:integrase